MTAVALAIAAAKKVPAWLWVAFLLTLLLTGCGVALWRAGYSSARSDTLSGSIQALHERKAINEEIVNLDAYRLCLRLGGLPDECRAM